MAYETLVTRVIELFIVGLILASPYLSVYAPILMLKKAGEGLNVLTGYLVGMFSTKFSSVKKLLKRLLPM